MKYLSTLELKLIYIFRINDKQHEGCLKIGETTSDDLNLWGLEPNSKALNEAAKKRINGYTRTAGIEYELLYTELAIFAQNKILVGFTDSEVREVLYRSGYKKKEFNIEGKANEWVVVDLETAKKAIKAVKEGRSSLLPKEKSIGKSPIIFRPEQKEAIEKTKKQFKKGTEMLWFAKMRFGKTLSSLQVIKDLDFKRSLILTHRPVVDSGWFEDFNKIFYDSPNFFYGSKNKGENFESLQKLIKKKENRFIYFASMQDLRGSSKVGGNFDKNNEVFKAEWDFIIVDEAHEGTQTDLGKNVLNEVTKAKTKILHLSGTPFNLLDNYKEEQIFTWDYVMEQKAKDHWDKFRFCDTNPYASLPKLNINTFSLSGILKNYDDEEVAFNFREFFRVNEDGSFKHKKDVSSFLDLICKEDKNSNYPFSTKEFRDNFRHSLWMVPGVKEAKALSALLQSHSVFSQFKIVNVAGDGDEEESKEEALKKVLNAIGENPHETYSITLSCGRLTTGVSVPAWTAVLMLSGSYNTSASSYMQTIFRVQTPATINGKIKTQCYVFDFAPDRALKVIAEAAKISAKAGKTKSTDREILGEFLNFCPIISVQGSKMTPYNTDKLFEQLKRVYVERVVKNGFEDNYLYNNDELLKLNEVEVQEFDNLKKIIGSTKANPKTGEIDVNSQGFTNEQYEEIEKLQKKKKQELTQEEKKKLEELKKKKEQRDIAISILRGISIRMPLLIYGADVSDEDKELDIDNFAELVDNTSWDEFMPKGVTKQEFKKFKKYYEPDVFRAAGKRIRAIARAADSLTIEDRISRITAIFATFRNPDKETVLTPWRVVNMHLGDCLGGFVFYDENMEHTIEMPRYVDQGKVTEDVYHKDAKILEINSKSGLYPLFAAYSIYRKILHQQFSSENLPSFEDQLRIWDKVVAENIFVICKTPMAKSITKRTLVGFRKAKVNTSYFEDLVNQIINKPEIFIKKVKQGKSFWKANSEDNMNFDAIIGNPPYQIMDGGASASAKPIYNHFVDFARLSLPKYVSMIMPTRWYSGGKGLDEFRESMLGDKQISLLHDYLNPEQVFPKTNIRGGICYFLWNKGFDNLINLARVVTHKNSDKPTLALRLLKLFDMDTFIRHNEAVSIVDKIKSNSNYYPFADFVSPLKPFGFRGFFTSHDKFRENKKGLISPVICFGKGKKIGYVEKTDVTTRSAWIDRFKVFTPRANNIGTELNDDNLNTFIGKPGSVCTESYIVLGAELYLNEASANNLCKYCTTKFFRFLHSLAKSSQDATSKTYKFVPLQDFTEKSDIDWSKSVPEIDQQLFQKYKLNADEIAFIEKMIKPMA